MFFSRETWLLVGDSPPPMVRKWSSARMTEQELTIRKSPSSRRKYFRISPPKPLLYPLASILPRDIRRDWLVGFAVRTASHSLPYDAKIQCCPLRRRSQNLCTICGDDLRGSPDRCPECRAVRQLATAQSV